MMISCIFSSRLLFPLLALIVLPCMMSPAHAEKTLPQLIMPPKYDYGRICKAEATRFNPAEIEKLRQRPIAELSPETLMRLAEAYSENDDVIAPDYPFVLQVTDMIMQLPYRGDNRALIDDALFMKYDISYTGKSDRISKAEAKAILDKLISHNHDKAYRRYGEMYEEEQRFTQAAEAYKKAIVGGNISAYFNLAKLYYQQKVSVSPEEFRNTLSGLHTAVLPSIAKGNCKVMVDLAKFYGSMQSIEGAKAYGTAWYKEAASAPIVSAKMAYANLLLQEDSGTNQEKVLALWKEAAGLGSVTAMRNLGQHYLSAEAFNPAQAALWLQQASQRKDVKASTLMMWAESLRYQNPASYEQVASIYERAAAQGHMDALYRLGRLYHYDVKDKEHLAKAHDYYRKAAEAKIPAAMRALQAAYSCNIGAGFNEKQAEYWQQQYNATDDALVASFVDSKKDGFAYATSTALKRLRVLADAGDMRAKAILAAHALYTGDAAADQQMESVLQEDIAKGGELAGHYVLGVIFHYTSKFSARSEDVMKLLQRAADAGSAPALLTLGDIHEDRENYPKAIAYYQRAAVLMQGKELAYRKLYSAYSELRDVQGAIKSLEHLAANHDAPSMLTLAQHYHTSVPDPAKAAYWFEQATVNYPCDAETVQRLAASYRTGTNGAPLNKERADFWQNFLQQIPLRGHRDPISLARILLYQEEPAGTKPPSRKREALQYLTQLANAGEQEAQEVLIAYYFHTADTNQLVALLTELADGGSVASMIQLSNLYLSGFGNVGPDKKKVVYWLEQAKHAGSDKAAHRLAVLQQ